MIALNMRGNVGGISTSFPTVLAGVKHPTIRTDSFFNMGHHNIPVTLHGTLIELSHIHCEKLDNEIINFHLFQNLWAIK